jgi:transposase-like protein
MASTNSYPGLEPRVAALLRHHARRLAASDYRLEREDVEQELAVQLHLRADRFDLGRGSRATYHDRVVRHRAADLARNARAAKRGPAATLSLEELDSEHVGVEIGGKAGSGGAWHGLMLAADWEDTTALRCDLVQFLAMQPTRLQECCRLLLTDSVAETARVLGHHRSSVYAWVATLRERARTAGLGIYLGVTPTDSALAGGAAADSRHRGRIRPTGGATPEAKHPQCVTIELAAFPRAVVKLTTATPGRISGRASRSRSRTPTPRSRFRLWCTLPPGSSGPG